MESGLFMRSWSKQQNKDKDACPEVTLNADDQLDVMRKKCNQLRIPTQNTDNLPNGETVENHGEEPDRRFKKVQKLQSWDDFETELQRNKDTKGRDRANICRFL